MFGNSIIKSSEEYGINVGGVEIIDDKNNNLNGNNNENFDINDNNSDVAHTSTATPTNTSTSTATTTRSAHTATATATYSAIHSNNGDLIAAIADTSILTHITPHTIIKHTHNIQTCRLVLVDANLPPDTFSTLINLCRTLRTPIFFEPTSDIKCVLPISTNTIQSVRTHVLLY